MNKDYKEEIRDTRLGAVGSSDAVMLMKIASTGAVPASAKRRLAVCKGLVPHEEVPTTAAMEYGDYIEQALYDTLSQAHEGGRYESNPLWESKKYSKPHVRLISHPDIVFKDDATRTLHVYEVKTTKETNEEARHTYRAQLFTHYTLAKERVLSWADGRQWKVRVHLVTYDTNGLEIKHGLPFPPLDPSRITITLCHFTTPTYNVDKAMTIIDDYLAHMDVYVEGDEVEAKHLPITVREQFVSIAEVLEEIKEREAKVEEFKARLYTFLTERDIKKVSCDSFSFTEIGRASCRERV